ncbi:MAG: thermonuclease family protein [Bacteroidota bacterium]
MEINKVHDGDTIEVSRKGREVDVRFYGIDCPEKDQPYGMTAKKYVSRMIQDRDVEVEPSGEDQYGRVIGLVYVDGKLLNEALIMNGFAWVYDRYCNKRICDKWKRLEKKAREANGYANNFVNRKSEKSGSPLRQESTGGYNL